MEAQRVTFGTLLALGRVSNLPTVWSNVVVAFAVVAGARPASLVALGSCLFAGTALYIGGMFLNDAYDADIDARERPERPIPSGRASRNGVFSIGFALLGAGVAVSALAVLAGVVEGFGLPLATLTTALFVWAYDRSHKGVAWSPLLMGACRAGLVFMGAFAATPSPSSQVGWVASALFAYVVGLTHVARFETGTTLDKSWVLGALAAPALVHVWLGSASWVLFAPWLAVHVVWTAVALGRLRSTAPGKIGKSVVALIAGISLVDAMFAGGAGHVGVAVFAVACFGLTLVLQRWVSGT
jgi:4-hydroxybenzoate polyprenyltransferase